ncbi:MAG: metal-binding protein [Xenococcaceae cyanobacterium]
MPSGKNHDRITLWTLPWIVGGALILTRDGELTLIVASAFLFSGLMFGPDLDIYSIQFKRWGILRYFWLPYQKIFRHRSGFSHGLIIGTAIRVVYFLSILIILSIFLVAIAQLILGFDWNWQIFTRQSFNLIKQEYTQEAIALFCGLELGAMSHSLSDWLSSIYKQRQKKKKS